MDKQLEQPGLFSHSFIVGQPVLENFDILEEAGSEMTAVTHTFRVDVVGGRLVLAFIPVEGDAIVSNIKIVRQQPQ